MCVIPTIAYVGDRMSFYAKALEKGWSEAKAIRVHDWLTRRAVKRWQDEENRPIQAGERAEGVGANQ